MKIGLFFSSCDNTLTKSIDLEALSGFYKDLPSVQIFNNFYDPDDFAAIIEEVEAKQLDSLVLAGETPTMFNHTRNGDYLFVRLAQSGVNINRMELVNLKNLLVRANAGSPRDLLAKAQVLVDVGLAKVRAAHDLKLLEVSPRKSVAILGANSGSIAAAQLLLDAGFKVSLFHEEMGFKLHTRHRSALQPTYTAVLNHPRFTLYDTATVIDSQGFAGDFVLSFEQGGKELTLSFGAVILSPGDSKRLGQKYQSHFHINFDDTSSFRSKDDLTSRNRTRSQGVYVINPISDDFQLADRLQAADATAADVINLLNSKELYHKVTVSEVDEELCGGCGACIKTCMFHAVAMQGNPPHAVIDSRRCQGCGNCVTSCPADARDLITCPTNYLYDAVEILARFKPPAKEKGILAIACDGCGYQCFDNAADMGFKLPMGIMPLWTVCGGQIDTQLIMHAYTVGFTGVALMICAEGCCHHIVGNVDLERRLNLFKQILDSRGISEQRLRVIATCNTKSKETIGSLIQFHDELARVDDDLDSWAAVSDVKLMNDGTQTVDEIEDVEMEV